MIRFLPLSILLVAIGVSAQTTYTTTADECNGKANMFCILDVTNQFSIPSTVALDNRNNYENIYPHGWGNGVVHGLYSGFVPNPNGTQTDFYSTGYFLSDDGTVKGTFNYKAHYVRICAGRGCGGTLGWHYLILKGSTVETP